MANSFWDSPTTPIAIAHRGGAGPFSFDRFRQENTLASFQRAVTLGYEYLELDVIHTADDKVVILHVTADKFEKLLHKPSSPDATKLQSYTYADLKKALKREVPTLEETLKAFPSTKFLIDAKTDGVVEPLAKLVKATKSLNRLYLNSFFVKRVTNLQRLLGPQTNCGVIIGRHPRLFNRRLDALYRGEYFTKGFSAITVPRRFLKRPMVELIHKHGLKALVWAPNTKKQIRQVAQMGADGIISDNIQLLAEELIIN